MTEKKHFSAKQAKELLEADDSPYNKFVHVSAEKFKTIMGFESKPETPKDYIPGVSKKTGDAPVKLYEAWVGWGGTTTLLNRNTLRSEAGMYTDVDTENKTKKQLLTKDQARLFLKLRISVYKRTIHMLWIKQCCMLRPMLCAP